MITASHLWTISSPEHVAISLQPAPLGARLIAASIDIAVCLVLAGSFSSLCQWIAPSAIAPATSITGGFLIFWGYPAWFESRKQGRTPGKQLMHLQTVDDRGLRLSARQCIIRSIVRMVDMIPAAGGLGIIWAWCDPWHRRLGDLAAHTLVIHDASHRVPPRGFDLSQRHSSFNSPRLRRLVAHRIDADTREFLLTLIIRADDLEPANRFDLMERCGALLRHKLRVDDEPGLSGEAWVRGIAALCWKATPGRSKPLVS